MKKILLKSLLAIIVLLGSTNASAYDFEVDGIYYKVVSLGEQTCQVTGNGYNSYSGNIVIPAKVNYANRTLTVISIGNNAFYGCSNLESITIPNSIISIGDQYDSVVDDDGYGHLTAAPNVFTGCTGLKKVIVKDIAAWCRISFEYDSNPLYYAHHLYSDEETEITDLVIPNSITEINTYAFQYCSGLESITIPDSFTKIGREFIYCSGLKNVTIGNSVTEIANDAFEGCTGLESVTIGKSVLEIGEYAFYGCSKLATLYSLNTTPPSVGSDNFTNNQYMTLKVYVPEESLEAYQSAETWKNFWNLQGFDPTGVESVKSNAINGNNAYYDLRGNRLDAPKKGLNIINGKKVIVK